MKQPIPSAALDDRLGFVGTSGSGKTYAAGVGVERLLHKGARVIIIDPLGVWWGLRLDASGKKPSPFPVVIFGGPHADLPLSENAGKLIGETVAGMKESCIIALNELQTKSAERRFMLAFLDALYRKSGGEPFHVVFDEADLWAPQKSSEPMLQSLMEQIVRRGRTKGFVPWLITQRPAVLSKDVLSQVDGLIAMKLTSSQDRDAIGNWVEGQADKQQWRDIWSKLPTMARGQGVLWLPARGVLDTVQFPEKVTFDSSRAPKRGERMLRAAELKPIDLGKLKERLSTVEAETKANDPRVLRSQLAEKDKAIKELQGKLTYKSTSSAADPQAIKKAEQRGFDQAKRKLMDVTVREIREAQMKILGDLGKAAGPIMEALKNGLAEVRGNRDALIKSVKAITFTPSVVSAANPLPRAAPSVPPRTPSRDKAGAPNHDAGDLTRTQQSILDAIAWVEQIGEREASRTMVAFLAGSSPKSSTFERYISLLRSAGLIASPRSGFYTLTQEGRTRANFDQPPLTHEAMMQAVRQKLTQGQFAILGAAVAAYPNGIDRDELANNAGSSPTSSTFERYLSQLRSLALIESPERRVLRASDKLFPAPG